jgi:two-component system OmpR family response regulator
MGAMQAFRTLDVAPGAHCAPGLRLLIVEDEPEMAGHMAAGLAAEGHFAQVSGDGLDALSLCAGQAFDVMIVDRLLPRLDGLSLVRALRGRGVRTPVLFLTALGTVADRVAGLEAGGDDYLVKPFAFDELHARVKALKRRSAENRGEPTRLESADLVMDRLARQVRVGGVEVDLLPLEYRLLEVLLLNAGQPVTRMMLFEQVWGFHFDPRTNIVETHISRMRAKLEAAGGRPVIRTIRGTGYVVDAAAQPFVV